MEEAQALQGRLFHDLEAIQSEDLARSKPAGAQEWKRRRSCRDGAFSRQAVRGIQCVLTWQITCMRAGVGPRWLDAGVFCVGKVRGASSCKECVTCTVFSTCSCTHLPPLVNRAKNTSKRPSRFQQTGSEERSNARVDCFIKLGVSNAH